MSILDDAFAKAAETGSSILIDGNLTSVHAGGLVTSIYQPSPTSRLGGAPATYDPGPPAALQFDFENIYYFSGDGEGMPPDFQFASVTLTQRGRTVQPTYTMAVTFWDGSSVARALNVQCAANVDAGSGVVYGSGTEQPFVTLLFRPLP